LLINVISFRFKQHRFLHDVIICPQVISQHFKNMLGCPFTISIHQKVPHINENAAVLTPGEMIIFPAFPIAHET